MIKVDGQFASNMSQFRRTVDETSREIMLKQGRDLARQVEGSLVRRKRPSFPGETPSIHGSKFQRIDVAYDAAHKQVLVYPRRYGSGRVPEELEAGTGRMKPRPYMAPVFNRNASKIINDWRNTIK